LKIPHVLGQGDDRNASFRRPPSSDGNHLKRTGTRRPWKGPFFGRESLQGGIVPSAETRPRKDPSGSFQPGIRAIDRKRRFLREPPLKITFRYVGVASLGSTIPGTDPFGIGVSSEPKERSDQGSVRSGEPLRIPVRRETALDLYRGLQMHYRTGLMGSPGTLPSFGSHVTRGSPRPPCASLTRTYCCTA
jgi:hypothetical protein